MLVCICNGVSDSQIKQTLKDGASSFEEVHARLGVAGCCGECECYARSLVEQSLSEFEKSLARNAA